MVEVIIANVLGNAAITATAGAPGVALYQSMYITFKHGTMLQKNYETLKDI